MQPANHVHFGDPKGQSLPDRTDNFVDRVFEGVCVTILRCESAELA